MDSKLSLRIMYDLFTFDNPNFEVNYNECELVIINLNSVFSTTFYEPMIEEFMMSDDTMGDYVDSVGEMFKKALMHFSSQRILLIYSDKVSNLTEIYEDWRKSRYKNKSMNEFAKVIFNHFIDVFNQIEDVNPTVDIINTEEFDPAIFTHSFIRLRDYNKKIFLISRDRLDFLNIENENVLMFDGQEFYTEKNFREHECKKLPEIHIQFLKYYYRLRGIKKYDYPGVRGFGPKRTFGYMENNISNLVDGYDKYNDEELRLFDFDKFIDGLSSEQLDKLLEIVNKSKF